MITPKTTLDNPYYFIKDKVVYEISKDNGGDSDCAQHKVTYLTESKPLKKGDTYYDLHGDMKKAEADGNYNVKKEEIDIEENKKIFPYFYVTTALSEGSDRTYGLYVFNRDYFWLQSFISDGDTLDNSGKFWMNTHDRDYSFDVPENYDYNTNIRTMPYNVLFQYNIYNEIVRLAKLNYDTEKIKSRLPYYCFSEDNQLTESMFENVKYQNKYDKRDVKTQTEYENLDKLNKYVYIPAFIKKRFYSNDEYNSLPSSKKSALSVAYVNKHTLAYITESQYADLDEDDKTMYVTGYREHYEGFDYPSPEILYSSEYEKKSNDYKLAYEKCFWKDGSEHPEYTVIDKTEYDALPTSEKEEYSVCYRRKDWTVNQDAPIISPIEYGNLSSQEKLRFEEGWSNKFDRTDFLTHSEIGPDTLNLYEHCYTPINYSYNTKSLFEIDEMSEDEASGYSEAYVNNINKLIDSGEYGLLRGYDASKYEVAWVNKYDRNDIVKASYSKVPLYNDIDKYRVKEEYKDQVKGYIYVLQSIGFTPIKESELYTLILSVINDKTVTYADKLLSVHSKKMVDNVVIVNEENTTDIE